MVNSPLDIIKFVVNVYAENIDSRNKPFNSYRIFLAHHSQYFPSNPEKMMKIKRCYNNSIENMIRCDYGYVEGWVTYLGIPMEHAWNVDKFGEPLDFTCRLNGDDLYATDHKHEYYGIEIPKMIVAEVVTNRLFGKNYASGILGTMCLMSDKKLRHFREVWATSLDIEESKLYAIS